MDSGGNRGQSAVLAFVLIVGIVAAGSGAVLLFGASATQETRDQAELERVETSFLELDNRLETVSRSEADEAVVDMDLPDSSKGAVREEATGRMVISRVNITTGNAEVLVDQELGAIVYDEAGTHYGYQAGGVWRGVGNDSQMVSPPSISYATNKKGNEPTLTVPLPAASGAERLTSGEVRLTKDETISPVNDVTIVEGDLVVITVQSKYYRAWADYFETITASQEIELDHANDTAIVEMVVPATTPEIDAGVIVGAPGERLRLKQDSVVDSYNSTAGDYSSSSSNTTRVIAAGDVTLRQNATIRGSLEVEGTLTMQQFSELTGNLRNNSSAGYTVDHDATIAGWQADNASVAPRPEMDGVIDRNVALIRENNDNDTAANVTGGSIDGCWSGNTCKLSAGNYFLDEISLDGSERLVLDTAGGPVNLAVLGKVQLRDDAEIEVRGGGRVNLYLDSETGTKDFMLKNDASVTVPDQRSPQFWLYMDTGAQAMLQQRSVFTGVIYGPGDGSPGTEIHWQSNDEVNVYGAVVGDVEPVTQEIKIHYDEALAESTAVRTAIAIPRVTYLHVSVNKVEIDDE